jgi:DNA (cytosine-5)-methyltransferase 1
MADGSAIVSRATGQRPVLMADLFCGAGGSSTGAERALRELGRASVLVAVNHWQIAIDTHTRNHPLARHHCTDLEHAKPRELVPEGRLDLLIASPTCTFHSRARGGRPIHDQQRMDPWHVVRWCTDLRVARLLIENVPEFVDWGPCSLVTGRPIPSRRGEYFRAWCDALRAIGYRLDHDVLCCADYGDPTTRERFFLIGRSDRGKLHWPEPTHTRGGAQDLLGARARWRAAAEIIDWSIPGKSIFTRKRPLKPNTLRRILAGAERYGWPEPYRAALRALLAGEAPCLDVSAQDAAPFLVHFRGTSAEHLRRAAIDPSSPLPTITAGGSHVGLIMATGAGGVARDLAQPIPTVTAGGDGGARPHMITPLLMGVGSSNAAKPVREPAMTITTGGGSAAKHPGNARPQLIEPLIAPYYGGGSGLTSKPSTEPLDAITTKARFGLAEPIIVSTSNSSSPGVPRSACEPVRTITTAKGGDMAVASPILMRSAHSDADGRDPASRVLDAQEPMPAQTGSNEFAIATPVIECYRIDILYRMLNWRELARAMSFDDEGEIYHFAGNATEITKQIGNAVPGRTAKALVRALMDDTL